MKLDWGNLKIVNFKSFIGEHTFPIGDYEVGVHFITGRNEDEPRLGPNGAGKSTLWDALCWCLYGRTPDGLRNTDISPWSGDKPTVVSVEIRCDEDWHVIERSANPNTFLIDEEPAGLEQVDRLVMTFDLFVNAVLMGQGRPLFYDLQPKDKMELFSEALNLDRWERRSQAASDRVREFETERATLDGELAAIETTISELKQTRDKLKARAADWRLDWGNKMRTVYDDKEALDRSIVKIEDGFAEADSQFDWACTMATQVRDQWNEANQVEAKLVVSMTSLESKVEELAEELKHLESAARSKSPKCPTCGQDVRDLKMLRATRRRTSDALAKYKKQLGVTQATVVQAKLTTQDLKGKYQDLEHKAQDLQAARESLQTSLADAKAKSRQLQVMLDSGEEEQNPYHDQIADVRKRLLSADRSRKEKLEQASKLGRRIERAKFWVKGFKDLRLELIEDVLQELDIATNAALDEVGLVGWSVSYDIERQTKKGTAQRGLNVMIKTPKVDRRVRWENWSGGEGLRLKIVGALALSQVLLNYSGVETALEILDEPAHFMAPEGVRELTDYLAWRAQIVGKKTFYIDHLSIENARFSSTTTILKTAEGSRIA